MGVPRGGGHDCFFRWLVVRHVREVVWVLRRWRRWETASVPPRPSIARQCRRCAIASWLLDQRLSFSGGRIATARIRARRERRSIVGCPSQFRCGECRE